MAEEQQQAQERHRQRIRDRDHDLAEPVTNTTRTCNKLLGVNWLTGEVR